MNIVESVLLDNFDELALQEFGLTRQMRTALLTPRFVTSRHVVGMVFAADAREPCLVAKVARRPGDNGALRREGAILQALANHPVDPLPGIPRVLGTFDVGAHTVLVETAVRGLPLDSRRVCADPHSAALIGTRFVSQLPVSVPAPEATEMIEDLLLKPLEALARHAPLAGETAQLVRRTRAALRPLCDAELPTVFLHGDLSHPNIFVGAGGVLQVVDWERSSVQGLPGEDLTYYLQYLGECVESAYTRLAQLRAFDHAFWDGGWARRALIDHLASRAVSRELLPQILVATWARSASTLVSRLLPHTEDPINGVLFSEITPAQVEVAVAQDRDFWLWRHSLTRAMEM